MRELDLKKELCGYVKKTGWFLLFLGFVTVMATGCSNNVSDILPSDLQVKPQSKAAPEVVDVVANAPERALNEQSPQQEQPVETVSVDEAALSEENDAMTRLSIEDYGRPNPFLPPYEVVEVSRIAPTAIPTDLVTPPIDATADSDASRIIRTKVSGILFDENNPAAILNMEGSDYLVRTGDVVNNYKVLAIYKNNVAVQLGENIYKAGVGELLAVDKVNYNVVPNLGNRFGGSSTKTSVEE